MISSFIYKLLPLVFILNYSSDSILSSGNLKEEIIQCSPDISITIKLSEGYSKNSVTYEEGVIKIFTFSDSSYIFIFCGRMQTFPMLSTDKHQVIETKEENDVISRLGVNSKTSKIWREDNYYKSGIAVAYDNVSKNRQIEFNNMIESIEIKE